jgi:hypothetical protein
MQVKITKRGDGMYVVTTQRDGKTVQEAVGKDRAKLRAIYVKAGHEVVKAWS